MKYFAFLLGGLFLPLLLCAHPWKPQHYVVVDTDGGIDDFRTIDLLFASPDIRVLGITVTPGVLSAEDCYRKVKAYLISSFHEGIPVGINDAPEIKPANFQVPADFSWGDSLIGGSGPSAIEVLNGLYRNVSDSVKFICLGSLNIVAKAAKTVPHFLDRTSAVIWSSGVLSDKQGFNLALDATSLKKVQGLSVPLKIVLGSSFDKQQVFDEDFAQKVKAITPQVDKALMKSFSLEHSIYYDENVALWLHFPAYFSSSNDGKVTVYAGKQEVGNPTVQAAYLKILRGETVIMNQVLNAFSTDTSDYFADVRPIMAMTIEKYGREEWVAEVMANELHRHLGVFAIVGAKMGIRAKEYFGAGIDELKVVSYAGLIPPFSCMNDGLQVSTGATLGHGLISVSSDSTVRPVAEFTYMGRTIRVILKPYYARKIASEVKELNSIYGLNSNIYWELIRRLAIKYWANFDRHEIFEIQELKTFTKPN